MIKNSNIIRLLLGLLFLIALILIRGYENVLFYDPFIIYFKQNFHQEPFPIADSLLLFASYTFRFFINSIFSLGILWCVFQRDSHLKLVAVIYLFFLTVLLATLTYSLNTETRNFQILIYTRRFLIHPLLLLICIGALYYQKRSKL